jgi:hypothetical protein
MLSEPEAIKHSKNTTDFEHAHQAGQDQQETAGFVYWNGGGIKLPGAG